MQEARQLRQTQEGGGVARDSAAAASGRHQVDLDSLAFREGGHMMSNDDCNLPRDSYRTMFKVCKTTRVPLCSQHRKPELSGAKGAEPQETVALSVQNARIYWFALCHTSHFFLEIVHLPPHCSRAT